MKSNTKLAANTTIRNAKPDDAEQIAKLIKSMWLATYSNQDYDISYEEILEKMGDIDSSNKVQKRRDEISTDNKKELRLVAVADDKIVGYIYAHKKRPERPQTASYVS